MCSCIETINKQIHASGVELQVALFRMENCLVARPYIPLQRRHDHPKKRGERLPSVMAPTYCPFCGDKYEKAAS